MLPPVITAILIDKHTRSRLLDEYITTELICSDTSHGELAENY